MSGPLSESAGRNGSEEDPSPAWLERDRYPFERHRVDLPPGRVHYVDEGEGRPVVMLHGNPTWSFLYRHLIRGLADEHRCIAPDLLGFGLSETPRDFPYIPEAHAGVFGRFVERLGLRDAVLVVHDWGGPIGLDHATRHPDDVGALVVLNTWMWPRDRAVDRIVGRAVGSPLGKLLVLRHNAFARLAIAVAVRKHGRLAPAVYRHYTAPLATRRDRYGTWVFAREVVGSRGWLRRLRDRREALAGTPALFLWGRRDPVHGPLLRRWRSLFPDASERVYDGVGHFVPEELGPDLVPPVREFLEGL